MKRIFRAIIFSAVALIITSLWNKGFKINLDPIVFLKTAFLIALFYYLVVPISKIIFLPVNFLTLGLLSIVLNIALSYFFFTRFSLVQIQPWTFPGFEFNGLGIESFQVSYLLNILMSAVSLSFIIKMLELLI